MDKRLLKWAKEMGYPGADSEQFKANVHLLINQSSKPVWKHVITHIRPASEVAEIKKQLLVYKVSIEGNPTNEPLEKFESLDEYNAFLKNKTAQDDIAVLRQRMAITKPFSSTDESAKNVKTDDSAANILEKYRTLVAYRKKLDSYLEFFKRASSLLEEYKTPLFESLENKRLTQWDTKVLEVCQNTADSSTNDLRVALIESSLKKILPPIESSSSENERMHLLKSLEDYNLSLADDIEALEVENGYLIEKLNRKKNEWIARFSGIDDLQDRVEKLVVGIRSEAEQKHLRALVEQSEQSTRCPVDDETMNEVIRINELIKQKNSDVAFYSTIPFDELHALMAKMFPQERPKVRDCAKLACQFIDHLKKLRDSSHVSEHPCSKSQAQVSNESETTLSKLLSQLANINSKNMVAQEGDALAKLKFSHVKLEDNPAVIISAMEKRIEAGNKSFGLALTQIAEIANEAKQLVTNSENYMNSWKMGLITEMAQHPHPYRALLDVLRSDDVSNLSPTVRNNIIKMYLDQYNLAD